MKNTANLYMVLDVTSLEKTKILYVDSNIKVVKFAQNFNANNPEIELIAPPIAGRSFSRFNLLQLQYLFWNTFGTIPCENYGELINICIEKTLFFKNIA